MPDYGRMRKTISRPLRVAGATIASFGLIIGLGACSSDADVEAFCSDGAAVAEQSMPQDAEGLAEFSKKLDSISAPSEIKDDWAVLQSSIKHMAEIFDGLDEQDPEQAAAALEELGEKVDTEKLDAAGTAVDKYINENCDI